MNIHIMTNEEKRRRQDGYLKWLFFSSIGIIVGVLIAQWLTQ